MGHKFNNTKQETEERYVFSMISITRSHHVKSPHQDSGLKDLTLFVLLATICIKNTFIFNLERRYEREAMNAIKHFVS